MCMAACPKKNAEVCKPADKVQESLHVLSCTRIHIVTFVLGRLQMSRRPS